MDGLGQPFWSGIAVVEEAAIAGTGAANAAFFVHRAAQSQGARRTAAAVLATLPGGVSLEAAGDLVTVDLAQGGGETAGAGDVLLQAPLLLALLATGWLVFGGRR